METKIQITCQCGYEQYLSLLPNVELYQCRKCGKPLFKLHVINGYVYILSNPAMPGLLKIGYTERDAQERVKELSNTGIPSPFEIEAVFESSKPYQDEQKIHNYFSKFKHSNNREFFNIDLKEALNTIVKLLSKKPCQIKDSGLLISEEKILQSQIIAQKNERKKQHRLHEKNDLMREYNVTKQELNMIVSEITDEDRDFYKGMSIKEILNKKLWEYKNW